MMDESLTTTSTEVLEHECTTLAAQIAATTCRFLLVIAELDRRESWGQWWGCKSMAHWLSWRCSLGRAASHEHVRVARALVSLPQTVAAFARGELSFSKVRALTRVANAESEGDLVELARTATAAQLEKIVRATVHALSDPETGHALRSAYLSVDDDGMGTLTSRQPIDQHAIIEQAIGKALPPKESSAEDSIAQRRVDALVRICESYLATGDACRAAPARNNAVVHVEVDPTGIVRGETESGAPVHPETCRRLLCNSSMEGMLGELGLPIGCGRQTRKISRKMRRAINRRSRGSCEWQGCDERVYVEAHHVWHWEHGGPTELWNLVNLCWHHHHLLHEGGWRLEHDGRGGVRCFRPDGTEVLDPVPVLAPPLAVKTKPDAIVPLWAGETFDLSMCVDAVLGARSG